MNLIEVIALMSALLVITIGSLYILNNTMPLSKGDMWGHVSTALQYSKGFPVHQGLLMPNYPYLFQIYLATLFPLSGLPSPLSCQMLFAISCVGALAFYAIVKKWLPEKNIPSIAVLLTPLLGFGSLYVLNLKMQTPTISLLNTLSAAIPKTYDINDIMIIGPATSNIVPVFIITLPALFLFLYLLRSNASNVTKAFLSAVLVAISYIGHIDGCFFMGLSLLLYSIIFKGKEVKPIIFGGLIGLLIIFLIDFSAPVQIYLTGFSSPSTLTFIATFFLFILSYPYSISVRRFCCNSIFFGTLKEKALPLLSISIIGVYIFSLIAWLNILPISKRLFIRKL